MYTTLNQKLLLRKIFICLVVFWFISIYPQGLFAQTPQQEGWTIIEKEIPYGDGPGEVGVYRGGEGDFNGPISFTGNDEGIIYVLDRVNVRIQVYSSNLDFLGSIILPPKSSGGQDIAVDKTGNVYILYPNNLQVEQYDKLGNVISTINLDPDEWHVIYGLPMYLRGNKLYIKTFNIAGIERAFAPVGKIVNGKLEPLSTDERSAVVDGYLLPSERQFKGNGQKEAVITDVNGSQSTLTLSAPFKGKHILGDDINGNIYFSFLSQGEGENRSVLNVMRFDSKGALSRQLTLRAAADFPQTRSFFVDKLGDIYYMQAGKNQLLLTVARPK